MPQDKKQKPGERKQDTRKRYPKRDFRKREKYKESIPPTKKEVILPKLKLFGKWDNVVDVSDPGLKAHICLRSTYLPRSAGAFQKHRFHKSNMHIVERLALHLLVPGHSGKRHRITSGRFSGNFINVLSIVEKAFETIEKKEKKNPLEVLVRAVENSALREEVSSYQLGSIIARDAVITAPQRRVDRALRSIAQGAYRKSFNNKKRIEHALAEEISFAYHGSSESHAVKERERIEGEAMGAR